MKIDTKQYGNPDQQSVDAGQGAKTPSIYANIPILDLHKIS